MSHHLVIKNIDRVLDGRNQIIQQEGNCYANGNRANGCEQSHIGFNGFQNQVKADHTQHHTTGKAGMSLLEKIMYMADYIEPNRSFEGLERLRELAYSDLDEAMILGYKMSLEDLARFGVPPHPNTLEALESYRREEKI